MTAGNELLDQKETKKYMDAIFWGGILLWAGLIFGADTMGYLPSIGTASEWSWIFLGAGVYGLLLGIIRLASDRFTNPATWDWVWAVIFLIIGLAGFMAISVPWWLILIVIGCVILVGALRGR